MNEPGLDASEPVANIIIDCRLVAAIKPALSSLTFISSGPAQHSEKLINFHLRFQS